MFSGSWLPRLFEDAFRPLPDMPIHEWAESGPFILRKSPEPTYRSSRTPWTRRAQDLLRKPWNDGRRVRRFGAKKCSRSGYTEGCILNPIRWTAKHRPRNCLVSVDSQKEVANIRERLVPTLQDLGQDIFTGNDDDLSKFVLRLRGMDIYFSGSFSAGGFSNKTADWVFNDEVDLYGEISDEGDTIENFWSRAKGTDSGFQVVLSKPAMKDGPIDSFHMRGNQEQWQVPCPFHGCHERQALEWDRVEFAHCKELTGEWDFQRILDETFYRCKKCGGEIRDERKPWMNENGVWVPTAKGDPEIITQHISDLYSTYEDTTLGHLAKAFVQAEMKDSRELKQTFWQQHLGLGWEEKVQKIEALDVLKLRKPYRRGTIPHKGCALALGMDVGLYTNTRWVVYAFAKNGEMWLVDWGAADGPRAAFDLLKHKRYACAETGAMQSIAFGFIDARYRMDEVFETCLLAPRQLFPVMGKKGFAARSIHYQQVTGKPEGFGVLGFIDRDAKFDLYIDRIKDQKPPGMWWPENVDEQITREHCAERLIKHKRTGKVIWEDDHRRPNHYGDASKIVLTGLDWMLGGRRSRLVSDAADESHRLNAADFEQILTAA